MKILFNIFILLFFSLLSLFSQGTQQSVEGIKVRVEKREKTKNSYIFITGGYQIPAWTKVPMTPENSSILKINSNMEVQVPGWFTGIGIMKKSKSRFEVGILADYFKSKIPVAYSGQRSTSDWVFEQNNDLSPYTQVFEKDINRIDEVIVFRGTIRYKIPVNNYRFWGGLTGGTFSNTVSFPGSTNPYEPYREISLGLTYQAGFDFILKDSMKRDLISLSIYTDLSGPEIEDKFYSIFYPGWKYINSEGNHAVNPLRIGFSVGLHIK